MATTRSNTLGCASLSNWMRILRLFMIQSSQGKRHTSPKRERGPVGRISNPSGLQARTDWKSVLQNPSASRRSVLERMLGGVLLGGDLVDLGFAAHGVLNGEL